MHYYYFIISLSRKAVLYLVSDPIRSRMSEETLLRGAYNDYVPLSG